MRPLSTCQAGGSLFRTLCVLNSPLGRKRKRVAVLARCGKATLFDCVQVSAYLFCIGSIMMDANYTVNTLLNDRSTAVVAEFDLWFSGRHCIGGFSDSVFDVQDIVTVR